MSLQPGHMCYNMRTVPLYGILVTHKSWLFSLRKLAHAHHANYLANRIAGHRLPTELVDVIAETLLQMQCERSRQLWKSTGKDREARDNKFGVYKGVAGRTEAENAAFKRMVEVVHGGAVRVHPEQLIVSRTDGKQMAYMHLSVSPPKPQIGMLVPGSTNKTGGPAVRYADGRMRVSCQPGQEDPSTESMEQVSIRFDGKKGTSERLIQLDGVETAVRGWDQESVDRFVKELELKVVAIEGEEGGGSRPRLRLWQSTGWHDWS